ncbi:MAG TPA: hypothetical protein VKU00_13200 [Chthonomonadaceae bacterium]|nr:hypothetical protein [Chthonomonadaceae bacterium]
MKRNLAIRIYLMVCVVPGLIGLTGCSSTPEPSTAPAPHSAVAPGATKKDDPEATNNPTTPAEQKQKKD